jgi:hypothetical protein
METIEALGKKYPVIAVLDKDFALVAHPNGAAIAGRDWLSVIYPSDHDSYRAASLKKKAIIAFHEWAWPQLAGQFNAPLTDRRIDAGSVQGVVGGQAMCHCCGACMPVGFLKNHNCRTTIDNAGSVQGVVGSSDMSDLSDKSDGLAT